MERLTLNPWKTGGLIKACVQYSKYKIKFNAEFSVETGLKQENALSPPPLFNIALESVMKEVLDDVTGLRIAERCKIKLAAYADNIIIIKETKEGVKRTTKN